MSFGDTAFLYHRVADETSLPMASTRGIKVGPFNGSDLVTESAAGGDKHMLLPRDELAYGPRAESSNNAAEQADRARCDFLSTLSHEMLTPLNAVIGYSARMLNQSDLNAEARRSAERIQNAAAALVALVEDILDLDKIEAGVIDVRTEPFSLRDLVAEVEFYVRPSAAEKGLTLDVQCIGEGEDSFLGDPHRLRQVLLNLLGNAVKFTRAGKVDLSVLSTNVGEKGRRLRFVVADTGIGIARCELEAVFQRFHQADLSINGEFGGAGLGLAIAKQLVERMSGSIHVESELGRGSTFWFELPLEVASRTKKLSTEELSDCTACILVAEDVVLNQELVRELLEARGHRVEIVANGYAAVNAVKTGTYDIVLMDLSMPDMDGLAATRLIRSSNSAIKTIPIIACTANASPGRMAALRAAGVDAILRKPLRQAELYATVNRIITQRQRSVGAKAPPPVQTLGPGDFLSDIMALVGPKRLLIALDDFTSELKVFERLEPRDAVGRRKLAAQAHAVISTACALNFSELAAACRDIENACHDGVGVGRALEQLAPLIVSALAESERLRSDGRLYTA
jgi:signal transduction histidine kinase/ActR/RegA family two-component response regulator